MVGIYTMEWPSVYDGIGVLRLPRPEQKKIADSKKKEKVSHIIKLELFYYRPYRFYTLIQECFHNTPSKYRYIYYRVCWHI